MAQEGQKIFLVHFYMPDKRILKMAICHFPNTISIFGDGKITHITRFPIFARESQYSAPRAHFYIKVRVTVGAVSIQLIFSKHLGSDR